MSNIFTIAIPDISSTNGAFIMTNFCCFRLISVFSLRKNGIDWFKKLKQELHKSVTPSSLKMF